MTGGAPERAGHGEVPMAAMVPRPQWQPAPLKAIAAVRGGYSARFEEERKNYAKLGAQAIGTMEQRRCHRSSGGVVLRRRREKERSAGGSSLRLAHLQFKKAESTAWPSPPAAAARPSGLPLGRHVRQGPNIKHHVCITTYILFIRG